MPVFSYRARDAQGQLIQESISFESEPSLREHLRARSLYVIDVREDRGGRSRRRVRLGDLIITVRQLRTMLNAGLPLVQGLDALAEQSTDPTLREVLRQAARSVRHGSTIGDALAEHEWVFPPLLVALVRSGEVGGRLPEALKEAARQLELEMEVRQKVVNALAYPLFTLGATILTVLFMLVFVVPVFEKIYKDLKAPLPAVTQLLVTIAYILIHYGWLVVIATGFGVYAFLRYARSTPGRRRIDGIKLRLPLFGPLFLKSAAANFTGCLAGLLESGLPLSRALQAAADVCGNAIIGDLARDAANRVTTGRTLSLALDETGVLPPLVVKMVAVGEQVGTLPHVLREINSSYVVDVDYTMRRLLGLIEPIMVLFVALIVGFVLMALYYPIFNLGNVFLGS
jgi:type IV pilus assembly protein PilC